MRLQGLQLWCGLARIAANAEVGRPRCFAHHQHQHRCGFFRFEHSGLGVIANALQRQLALRLFSIGQAADGVHRVERVEHVAQRLVVAHDGGQVLKHQHEHSSSQRRTQQHRAQLMRPALPAHGAARVRVPPPQTGQAHAHQQQPRQGERSQVTRFGHIGVERVGNHGRVDDHAIQSHEITRYGCHRQQHQAQRSAPPGPDHRVDKGPHEQGQRQPQTGHA